VSASVPVSHPRAESAPEPLAVPNGIWGATPPWVISLVGHLLVLASLWPIHMATSMFQETVVTGTVEDDEPAAALQQEYFHFDTAAAETIGNGGDSSAAAGDRVAPLGPAMETPRAPVLNVIGTATALGTQPATAIKRPVLDMGQTTPDRQLSAVVEMPGSSEHAGGVRGAVDRLAVEIDASLQQENTLVIWLFDATPSMKDRRETIADRFDNIYHELGKLNTAKRAALKTAVAKFGHSVEYLTKKPVDDIETIKKAIRKIKDDGDPDKDSVENVFGACLNAAERFRSYCVGKERWRVMVIAVTDERGSDFNRVEEAISKLRRLGMRVYAVGDDAVFGREKHFFPHVFRDGYRGLGYTLRGPETASLENVQLPFWAGSDYSEITSGFGPYALSRLCDETGGMFLISDELPGPKFDAEILRNYLPDYRPLAQYAAERERNPAKAALAQAAFLSTGEGSAITKVPRPRMQFRADNDNTFRQEISEAQRPLAELDYHLTELHNLLEMGEKSRPYLDTPRWRASFDLALGRVLAMRARAMGYNVMLAEMKTQPRQFQNAGDNTWRIVPASEDHAPPKSQKYAKRARELLEAVIEEHRGTQWALLAKEELSAPMAWDWKELHVDYPPPAPMRQPRNGIQLEEDRQRETMRRQQQRMQEEHPPVKE
jgi:hypothetical protein